MYYHRGVAKDRTYTFRGASDLGERLKKSRELLLEREDPDVDVLTLLEREFGRRLYRLRTAGVQLQSQSEMIRAAIELVVGSAEKIADDLYWADLYALEPPREVENEEWLAAIEASIRARRSVA